MTMQNVRKPPRRRRPSYALERGGFDQGFAEPVCRVHLVGWICPVGIGPWKLVGAKALNSSVPRKGPE